MFVLHLDVIAAEDQAAGSVCCRRMRAVRAPGAALHGFGAGLEDINLSVAPVLAPLDVHRAAIVFLDGHALAGEFGQVVVGEGKKKKIEKEKDEEVSISSTNQR